eukprot:scaffold109501_cov63-Phaeocystis_antarctica.AAC.1
MAVERVAACHTRPRFNHADECVRLLCSPGLVPCRFQGVRFLQASNACQTCLMPLVTCQAADFGSRAALRHVHAALRGRCCQAPAKTAAANVAVCPRMRCGPETRGVPDGGWACS